MVYLFVHAPLRKIAKILFLCLKNFSGLFHEIGIAKVLLTPKPCGVAKFCECELP